MAFVNRQQKYKTDLHLCIVYNYTAFYHPLDTSDIYHYVWKLFIFMFWFKYRYSKDISVTL